MATYSIDTPAFSRLIAEAARGGAEVLVPARVGERRVWRRAVVESLRSGALDLGPARAAEPVKSLFFPPRGEVSSFFGDDPTIEFPERIVLGVRQCDLAALRVLDYVFREGDFRDPFYEARRRRTVLISADCTEPYDVCFCSLVEGRPSPGDGFDLNLSALGRVLVVETGSPKGQELLDRLAGEHGDSLGEASESEIATREANREKVAEGLEARLRSDLLGFRDRVRHVTRGREEHPVWDARARDCVECGACNFVCPTCHCFYLLDVQRAGGARRFAEWDSCLFPKFARVAGGANPRARRAERLLNRFEKKFSFFCDVADRLACTGCGRCVEACAGRIDMRDVLKELVR